MPDSGYADYDHSRLGGTAGKSEGTYFIETVTDVVAVHIFSTKIIVIDADGNHTEYRKA